MPLLWILILRILVGLILGRRGGAPGGWLGLRLGFRFRFRPGLDFKFLATFSLKMLFALPFLPHFGIKIGSKEEWNAEWRFVGAA